MFDVPDYHLMYKRSVGMNDYDAYGPEEFVTVVVHVMEHLTGDGFVTAQRGERRRSCVSFAFKSKQVVFSPKKKPLQMYEN